MPDVQSSSAAPHRAVRNSQAAKFHSTLPFLPHLPDSAEEKACRVKKSVVDGETGRLPSTEWTDNI